MAATSEARPTIEAAMTLAPLISYLPAAHVTKILKFC